MSTAADKVMDLMRAHQLQEWENITDPSTGPWEVEAKGGPDNTYFETSVIRKNNQHGHASYGWIDANKMLISDSGGSCHNRVNQMIWDKLVRVAQEVADELNAEEVGL